MVVRSEKKVNEEKEYIFDFSVAPPRADRSYRGIFISFIGDGVVGCVKLVFLGFGGCREGINWRRVFLRSFKRGSIGEESF